MVDVPDWIPVALRARTRPASARGLPAWERVTVARRTEAEARDLTPRAAHACWDR